VTGSTISVTEQGPLWTTIAVRLNFVSPPGTVVPLRVRITRCALNSFPDKTFAG